MAHIPNLHDSTRKSPFKLPLPSRTPTKHPHQQALFIPIIYFFYPETSNLSLEDIDLIFLPEEMGGLNGNARVRMTPEMAAQRVTERGMSKDEVAEQVEKAKHSEDVA